MVQQLWQQGLSNPQNTALQGASHGGLMVANAMLHLPVRAVLCESPLIDMICTSKAEMLLYGKMNMVTLKIHSFKKAYVTWMSANKLKRMDVIRNF